MSNTIQGLPRIDPKLIESAVSEPSGNRGEFFKTLNGVMGEVAQLQTDAEKQVASLLGGNGVDVHSAMIAIEKADLAFELMVQVRNKIVQAYQEISRMPF